MSNTQSTPPFTVTEADLHAYVDDQLSVERMREIEAYLATRPDEAQRLATYGEHKRELHALFDPVLDEPLPARVLKATRPRLPWYTQRVAAGFAIALMSGAAGWGLRGGPDAEPSSTSLPLRTPASMASVADGGFARRAAIAHAVYSPDQRRPVEVSAEHEDQLVAWLSKRMGVPMKPPHLQDLGYALDGGRLLPGGQGPVAQFMYHDAAGAKLTLYVSNEVDSAGSMNRSDKPAIAAGRDSGSTAYRFMQQGEVNVFYWIDGPFGYAISAGADRSELARVSDEVYRQLAVPAAPKN